MRTAMEQHFDDWGAYPDTNTAAAWTAAGNPRNSIVPRYIAQVPQDPLTPGCINYTGATGCYGYAWNPVSNPIRFHLWVELETSNRAALGGDLDINSGPWSGAGLDASTAASEGCADNDLSNRNCMYDTGQR